MVHWAQINQSNIVQQVIVCDTKEWCEQNLGGVWKRTYYSTPGKQFAGQGYIYYPDLENFSAPQPYPSWILNRDTCIWEPPTPYPTTGNVYTWDEPTLSWKKLYGPNSNE